MPLANNTLTVAVWMVTYNHEGYIEQAIESVMEQETNFAYKLFIGEDCSTDTTAAICQRLQASYPNQIELVMNAYNLGPIQNAFKVYDRCFKSGAPYIALLEGDDYWNDPFKLQKQVDFLETNINYTFSMTRFLALKLANNYKDENASFFKDDSDLVYDFAMFTRGWFGGTLTLMFRTAVIDPELFKRYNYFRDVHLYTALLTKGNGVCQNFVSGVYRIHDKGQHNSLSKLQQAQTAVNCYQELYMLNPKVDALKIKYKYFAQNYIALLIKHDSSLKGMLKTVTFGFILKNPAFISKMLKKIVKSNGLIMKFKSFLKKRQRIKDFKGSEHYWEDRYKKHKNSGAGSYGHLAEFKAEVLNDFVKEHRIQTIIEFGCGDGHQLSLVSYPHYVGFDVSNKAIEICKEKFINDSTKIFYNTLDEEAIDLTADLTLSLDVIYHLIEDEVFEKYMSRLFKASTGYVIIYSSNYNKRDTAHVRSRKFTDWIDKNVSHHWELWKVMKNKYPFQERDPQNTSIADFYIYKNKIT